jgi:hypothetical protein
MAEVQISEPQVDVNFTDRGWRAVHAGQTGVLDDFDGSAFGITTPAEGNVVEIGSTTQPSRLAVDGYGLEIAKSTTQSLTIPASTGGTAGRTDLIVARLNPTGFTGDPGPVRLHRVPGTEGSTNVPAATYDPVGIRDLVLYRIRRIQGQGLNQASVTDMRPRLGYNYDVHNDGELPVNAPLASRASRGSVIYRRDLVSGAVDWVVESRPREVLSGTSAVAEGGEGFPRFATSRMVRDGTSRYFYYVVRKSMPTRNPNPGVDGAQWVGTLHSQDRPLGGNQFPLTGWAQDVDNEWRAAAGFIAPNGQIWWSWASTNNKFGSNVTDRHTLILTGTWEV